MRASDHKTVLVNSHKQHSRRGSADLASRNACVTPTLTRPTNNMLRVPTEWYQRARLSMIPAVSSLDCLNPLYCYPVENRSDSFLS